MVKVYGIFLLCVVGVWMIAYVSEDMARWPETQMQPAVVRECESADNDEEMMRAQRMAAEQEADRAAAVAEGIDEPAAPCATAANEHAKPAATAVP